MGRPRVLPMCPTPSSISGYLIVLGSLIATLILFVKAA